MLIVQSFKLIIEKCGVHYIVDGYEKKSDKYNL